MENQIIELIKSNERRVSNTNLCDESNRTYRGAARRVRVNVIIDALRYNNKLEMLELFECHIDAVAGLLRALERHTRLAQLWLVANRFRDVSPFVRFLNRNDTLRTLYLSFNHRVENWETLIPVIESNCSLYELTIGPMDYMTFVRFVCAYNKNTILDLALYADEDSRYPAARLKIQQDRLVQIRERNIRIAKIPWILATRLALARALERVDGDGYARRLITTL